MRIRMGFIAGHRLSIKGARRYIRGEASPTHHPRDHMRHRSNAALGVLLALAAVALFTPIFAAGKFAGGAVPALAIIWMRYLGGIATVVAATAATRTPLAALSSPRPHLHAVRALCGAGGGALAIHAASVLPVADAAAIGLTEGLMIVALAALLLKERVTARHWLAGGLCALGAFLVVRATTQEGASGDRSLEGAAAAFAGAFLIALETVLIKVLARQERALAVLAHVNVIAAILFAVPAWVAARAAGLGWADLWVFALLGPVAITAQFLNILAFRLADASILGPVSYAWILFAAVLGYVAFGEVPGPGVAAGAVLIVAGGVWLATLPTSSGGPPGRLPGPGGGGTS